MQLKLPELGEGVHEGELVKWRVKVGDLVKDDQPICEIMTDKATVELPSSFHGTVTALSAKEGEVVKVGQEMLTYENHGSAAKPADAAKTAPATGASVKAPAAPVAVAMQALAPARNVSAAASSIPVMAAPSTRRFAREAGVDLGQVLGTGPSGRVMKEDVEKAAKGSTGATAITRGTFNDLTSGGEERIAFRGLRKKIAEKMRQSKDHAAHFTYVEEADMTAMVDLRAHAKVIGEKEGVKVTYLPFVMKAMVAALRKFPILNSTLDEAKQEIVYKYYYNIGLSVQTDDGLMAPVIKNVEKKSVLQIAKEIQTIVERARAKKLTMDELTGSTITLTNAGTIGGLFATPVINYPEVAILGFNKIFRKPVVKMVNGREEIVIRDWTYFSISLDHRIVDGAIGAEFMKLFITYIENPALLTLMEL